jgi:thiamine-monophosphate kinase
MSENRSEISQLGEFGLIDHISQKFIPKNPNSIMGIGDDAAVITAGDDCLCFQPTCLWRASISTWHTHPIQHLGYKAVAVNVSDIAAMNGVSEQITVSIALSNRFSIEAVDALYAGIRTACDNYNVDLVGGDTTSSVSGLIISISVLGQGEERKCRLQKRRKSK